MTTRTNDTSGDAPRDPLHEKLCAWILGEATAEEAREVEAALENDPELRAERTRLEATIGVVQGAFPAQERLSGDAMVALAGAAQAGVRPAPRPTPAGSARNPWYRSGAFRAAAALTAVLGGSLFALRAGGEYSVKGMRDEVARVPEPSASAELGKPSKAGRAVAADSSTLQTQLASAGEEAMDALTEEEEASLMGLGYVGGDGDEALRERLADLQDEAKPRTPLDSARMLRSEVLAASEPMGRAVRLQPPRAEKESVIGVPRHSAPDTTVTAERAAPSGPATPGVSTTVDRPTGAASVAGGNASGSDDFFLGHGEAGAVDVRLRQSGPEKPEKKAEARTDSKGVYGRRGGGEAETSLARLEELGYGAGDSEEQEAASSTETRAAKRRANTQAFDVEAPVVEKSGEVDQLLALADELSSAWESESLRDLGEGRAATLGRYERLLEVPRALDRLRFDRRLSDDELARLAELLQRRYLHDCRRRPQETPRDMYYRWWGDNPFEDTIRDAQSTFSVDVDTASYVLARRYLREGHLPVRAQVRTEEFLNYFTPDLAAPSEGTFAVHSELAPSRFGGPSERWMLRVGVRGKDVAKEERQPLAITFVVDTSGSMRENNRLEVVKHAIRLLVGQLDARDSIGIVAFSSEPRLILPMTSAAQRDLIETALHPLQPNGSTNAEGGLKMGYELSRTALDPSVHSRVVFLSDGVANVGQTDQDRISQDVAVQRSQGIYLNTIGVGMNNHNDVFLEQLANKGDGICDYVDDADSAKRAIVDRFTGAMIPIASDVKIQVEFDPSRVVRYRLLGYENRAIADKDFRNDAVDAGEVGAGHQVVALYELELGPERDGAPLATVRLRWKEPKATGQHPAEISVTETETAVHWEGAVAAFANASPGYRRSALAAQLAEFLRRSSHAANDSFTTLFEDARALALEVKEEESVELAELVGKTIELGLPMQLQRDAIETLIDEYRRQQILEARLDALERAQETERLREDLQRRNLELELRLQELLLQELKRKNG